MIILPISSLFDIVTSNTRNKKQKNKKTVVSLFILQAQQISIKKKKIRKDHIKEFDL